jgi:hypothetical protein
MIKNIIDLLNTSDWYIGDEDIDIAKGKYKAPLTYSEVRERVKRHKTTK